jgi:hypothetical protein
VELEGESVLYKIGVDGIKVSVDDLKKQLAVYGLGLTCIDPNKPIFHDISCTCYDCRGGLSERAKD